MTEGKRRTFWTVIILFLLFVIISGSIVICCQYRPSRPIEISLLPPEEFQGEIYLSGAVSNPGIYPVKSEDSLKDILTKAGSEFENADLTKIEIHISQLGGEEESQKININRAEAWLIEALPGIGEAKARAIIDYREQNGPFRNISELINVEGIGSAIYEEIKHLITVTE